MLKQKDKYALRDWEDYRDNLINLTPVSLAESPGEKKKRIEHLKSDFVAFCKYYFPNYCQSEFAEFQKQFAVTLIYRDVIYCVREWARAHAKSVIAGVMLPAFLKFTGRLRNMLLVSHNETNAIELLRPLMIQLESNQRLIHDFGKQRGFGNWEDGKFVTRDGCSFRAIGKGQSPRGARNEEARPDYILCDDLDEDEACRNPRRLDQDWEWMSGALFGCFDITGKKRFVVVGNVIAKDSLLLRAAKMADDLSRINILDDNGIPSWKERFTLEECNYMIAKMGYRMSQREYFNNPISEGKVFKKEWMQFKKLPPLKAYRYLVAYLDPGFKKSATSDSKSLILLALHEGKYHVRKVFCGKASVEEMIEWGYAMDTLVKKNGGVYTFKMEEVFLQSLLYKDFAAAAQTKKYPLPVSGDTRKKPDKDARIESISGYFERGDIFFDEDIEKDHHCVALIEQLLNFEPGVRTLKDGPDALEGAIFVLSSNVRLNADITIGQRQTNKHKI